MRGLCIAVAMALCGPAHAETLEAPAIAVVVDRAMEPAKLQAVTRSITTALGALDPGTQVAVIAFASKAEVVAPLRSDRSRSAAALGTITQAKGGGLAAWTSRRRS